MTTLRAEVSLHRRVSEIGRAAWDACADQLRKDGMPVVAWTVRAPSEWDKIKDHCDNLIFEGFAA